jgi:phosphatidylglycerol:prolipoprotein diacylglycerol transferase
MIDWMPNPIALSLGPLQVHWYGIAYVAAIAGGTWLVMGLAKQRGQDESLVINAIILLAIAALMGGRAYHVIDQWAYYSSSPQAFAQIFLPPYSGLGIYGGLATGLLAMIWYVRRHHLDFWAWADIAAPAILLAQVFGRIGNFFNQELYGPPTNLPWGIAIDCSHRVSEYACPATPASAHFHPMFLYEGLLSLLGVAAMLWLWSRFTSRGRVLLVGDIGLLYFAWYGLERALLEFLRIGYNWTFFGVPMAQIVGIGAAVTAVLVIVLRHRAGILPPSDQVVLAAPRVDTGAMSTAVPETQTGSST